MLQGLDEPSSTLNDAAIDGLIQLGDVHELVEGENQLLEVAVTNVRLCVAEEASKGRELTVAAASNLVGRDQQNKKTRKKHGSQDARGLEKKENKIKARLVSCLLSCLQGGKKRQRLARCPLPNESDMLT